MDGLPRNGPDAQPGRPATGAAAMDRRRFLQGALAAAAGAALLPAWARRADGATLGATDGVLVTVQLNGGNDALNTVVPYTNSTYYALRGGLAVPQAQVHALDGTYGLHPSLAKLAARFAAGKVAVVHGVGQPTPDLSHFSATATIMAGTAGSSRASGWLGRWADGLAGAEDGLHVVTTGSWIPLHLVGSRAAVTALPAKNGAVAVETTPFQSAFQSAVLSFDDEPSSLGPWADAWARCASGAIAASRSFAPAYASDLPADPVVAQLALAARIINADLGARVVNCTLNGFDTHAGQAATQSALLGQLDAAIDAFFTTLSPTFAKRVTVLVFTEFGRRARANASRGTDHGWAGTWFAVGDQVRGGFHGELPSLTALDGRGDSVPAVDHRSVYATVLDRWLGGGADAVLGASYPRLDLFARSPGA